MSEPASLLANGAAKRAAELCARMTMLVTRPGRGKHAHNKHQLLPARNLYCMLSPQSTNNASAECPSKRCLRRFEQTLMVLRRPSCTETMPEGSLLAGKPCCCALLSKESTVAATRWVACCMASGALWSTSCQIGWAAATQIAIFPSSNFCRTNENL